MIIKRAIEQPLRTLCDNAGVEGSVVVEAVKKEKKNMGYNVDTEEMVDMFDAGVIDPTKVARSALQNAASVASLLLTTEAMITERRGEEASAGTGSAGIRPGRRLVGRFTSVVTRTPPRERSRGGGGSPWCSSPCSGRATARGTGGGVRRLPTGASAHRQARPGCSSRSR